MSSNITRQITFGHGNVNGIITPLIPFNCVYDIDFGLIRFMHENGYTNNSEFINKDLFNLFSIDTRQVIYKLYSRETENPLDVFLKDSVPDKDNLYIEFMKKHYGDIIRSSVHTGLYETFEEFKYEKSISAAIIYSNEDEYYMLNEDQNLAGIELIDSQYVLKRIKEFNLFFFKSIDDIYISSLCKDIHSKSIYLLDYRYNFNNNTIINSKYIEILRVNRNIINIINAYDRSRLGVN